MDRRQFNKALLTAGFAGFLPGHLLRSQTTPTNGSGFMHGVASGDPLTDRVIIWTRLTRPAPENAGVGWRVATDPGFQNVVRSGAAFALALRDMTVKVDVTGLTPGTTYYYQFLNGADVSPIGRTRTLPEGQVDRLRFGVCSCSNYPMGYFNAYRALAARADLDFVLHLGDYIYEYGEDEFGNGSALGRVPEPNKEIVTLLDYRTRYAQYRSDPDLQELHRQHPMIVVWDDHEVANDSWEFGAQNHSPQEGLYPVRKAAAQQAWHDWLPVRETSSQPLARIYRAFTFGDLMDLIMLDTRHWGRDEQVPSNSPDINDPARTLLGYDQEIWLHANLALSSTGGRAWRFLGQQVMICQLQLPAGPLNPDQWDGYGASRFRLLERLMVNGIGNVVVLTGDIHSSWGTDIAMNPFENGYNPATGKGSLAVEFVTPGITSPAITDPAAAAILKGLINNTHPHIKHVDLLRRGYMLMDVDHTRAQAEWYHPLTITEPNPAEEFGHALQTLAGTSFVVPSAGPSSPKPNPPDLAP